MYFGNTIDNIIHNTISQTCGRILYNPHNNCIDNFWRHIFDEHRFFIPTIFSENLLTDLDSSIYLNHNQLHGYYNLIFINSLEQYQLLFPMNSPIILSIESPNSDILKTSLHKKHVTVCYDEYTFKYLNGFSQNNIFISPCVPNTIRGLSLNSNVYQQKTTDLSIIAGNVGYDKIVQTVEIIKKAMDSVSIEIINNFETEYLHEVLSKSRAVFWIEEFCGFNAIYAGLYGCRVITIDTNKLSNDIFFSVVENIGDLIQNIRDYDNNNLENNTSSFRNSLYLNNNFDLVKQNILNLMEKII